MSWPLIILVPSTAQKASTDLTTQCKRKMVSANDFLLALLAN